MFLNFFPNVFIYFNTCGFPQHSIIVFSNYINIEGFEKALKSSQNPSKNDFERRENITYSKLSIFNFNEKKDL